MQNWKKKKKKKPTNQRTKKHWVLPKMFMLQGKHFCLPKEGKPLHNTDEWCTVVTTVLNSNSSPTKGSH